MPEYNCERCGKSFDQKSHFSVHKNRKTPCENNMDKIKIMVEQLVDEKINLASHNGIMIKELTPDIVVQKKKLIKKVKNIDILPADDILVVPKKRLIRVNQLSNTVTVKDIGGSVEPTKLKMIDLFAGTGAFTLAFEQTNLVQCVFANDMVESSKMAYDINFSHPLTLKNLNDIDVKDIPKHDILTGGFPCQPFSIAGKQQGFDDPRSNVFWKILEIIEFHKPKCVILENVKNIVSHDNGDTFITIITQLQNKGYHVSYKILNTSDISTVPQHRERIYIVCIKNKEVFDKFSLDFPNVQKAQISELLQDNVPKNYYYTDKSSTWDLVSNAVTKKNTVYQYRRVYVRENKSNECPTLTANMGTGGHNVPLILDNNGIRKFTPRECFNFQGFPQSYKFPKLSDGHLYKLAGNAVSVPVVKLIADQLVPLLVQ
jgi:DNA (cytosine-5)-methyltransferase 1